MKRVIEINESDFKDIKEYDIIFEEENADIAKVIKSSTPLNEVLDKIIEEIRCRMRMYKVSDFAPNRMKIYALSDVIDIIKKYKESEDE